MKAKSFVTPQLSVIFLLFSSIVFAGTASITAGLGNIRSKPEPRHSVIATGREGDSFERLELCVWTRYLGRRGLALAQELDVSPQAVYATPGAWAVISV